MQQKIVDKINAEWKKRSPDLDTLIAYLDQDFVDRRIFITGLSKNGTRHIDIMKKYPCFTDCRTVNFCSLFA